MTTRLGAVVLGDLGQNHQLPQPWHDCCSESNGKFSHSTAFPEALLQNWVKNHNRVASAGRRIWPEPEGEDYVSTPPAPGGRLQDWCEQQPFPGTYLHQGFRKSASAQDASPVVIEQLFRGSMWMRVSFPVGFQDQLGFFTDWLCSVWSHWWGWGGRSGRLCARSSPRSCDADTALAPALSLAQHPAVCALTPACGPQKLETRLPQLRWGLAACGAVSPARPAAH